MAGRGGLVVISSRLLLIGNSLRAAPGRGVGSGHGARGAAGSADRAEPTRSCHEWYWLFSLLSA
jgi:hypothetical protein